LPEYIFVIGFFSVYMLHSSCFSVMRCGFPDMEQ